MNKDIIQGKWSQVGGEIKKQWGKLTDDDIMQIEGQRDKLEGMLQERYGYTRQKAQDEVDNFVSDAAGRLSSLVELMQRRIGRVQGMAQDVASDAQDAASNAQSRVEKRTRKTAKKARKRARKAAGRAIDSVETAAEDANKQLGKAAPGAAADVVESYPWLVVVGALIAGVLIGLLLSPGSNNRSNY